MNAPTLTLSTCHDIYTAVPYLLGFHPENSLVLLVLRDEHVEAAVRFERPNHFTVERWKTGVAELLGRHEATTIAIAAYGTPDTTTFAVHTAREVAKECGLDVADVLRVHPDSYTAASCSIDRCPTGGHPVSPAPRIPAVEEGLTPRQRRRRAAGFTAAVKDVRHVDETAAWLRPAFDAEIDRIAVLLEERPESAIDEIHTDGINLFDEHATNTALTPEQTAGMLIALTHKQVRDHALMLTDRYGPKATSSTWRYLAMHAPSRYQAAPTTLHGYAAWRLGDTALAKYDFMRALATDCGYVLARFFLDAVNADIPAQRFPPIDALWLTDAWMAPV